MLIQCKLGPRQIDCGGYGYDFTPDQYGRAVAVVHNPSHIKCFLAVTHYQEVAAVPEDAEPEEDDAADGQVAAAPVKRGRKARA